MALFLAVVMAVLATGCRSGSPDVLPAGPQKAGKSGEFRSTVKPGKYTLRFPAFQEKPRDFRGTIQEYAVTLVVGTEEVILLPPKHRAGEREFRWGHLLAGNDEQERIVPGWAFSRDKRGNVSIAGYMGVGEAVFRVKLHGQPTGHGGWKGEGATAMGVNMAVDTQPLDHHFQWSLTPKGQHTPRLSDKVTYDGPPVKTRRITVTSQEHIDRLARNRPPINPLTSKSMSYSDPEARVRAVAGLPKMGRQYMETKLLSELAWEEIQIVPSIILLTDHLAGLDVGDQSDIAVAYARDGSAYYFGTFPYADLRRIPLAFLLVHCYPKLDEVTRKRLSKGSVRFALILKETESYKDAPVDRLDEIMVAVLTKLSAEDRANYFRTSGKLKSYVAASKHEGLRALLPRATE
jgi:hypothetical protein